METIKDGLIEKSKIGEQSGQKRDMTTQQPPKPATESVSRGGKTFKIKRYGGRKPPWSFGDAMKWRPVEVLGEPKSTNFKKKTCEQDGVWNEPLFQDEYFSEHDRRRMKEERDENSR